jgi:hypothetical protein
MPHERHVPEDRRAEPLIVASTARVRRGLCTGLAASVRGVRGE